MKIAIDAMGGDNAPSAIVEGALLALKEFDVKIVLVGRENEVYAELKKHDYDEDRIEVVNADEVIGTDEAPVMALRKKKNSSINVGINLVKEKKAAAFVSAGSTGALLAGSTLTLGRIPGVERPVLGTIIPNAKGGSLVMDSGANTDCKPQYLLQFAKMGKFYAEYVMGRKDPVIKLLNIGEEREKGNSLVKETYPLLEEAGINFKGNIEPKDIPFGAADVIVCDGFVGNTVLKYTEGIATVLMGFVQEEIMKVADKETLLRLKPAFGNLKTKFDPDEVGGAPFMGLNALVVKAHGNSGPRAIKNAVKQSLLFVENDIVKKIEEGI
ncbi:MAG: phosphate acyltransferase PlsX [Firmicutes bacterium]|nr:phosphate acyltransferase PlsX [Bacillota bacterium]